MFEDTILLKIKRDFTENEAIAYLKKLLSEKQIEIGMLKSELAEVKHKLVQPKNTKKEWLKDELIAHLDEREKAAQKNYKSALNSVNEWRNKYFSLIAKKEN